MKRFHRFLSGLLVLTLFVVGGLFAATAATAATVAAPLTLAQHPEALALGLAGMIINQANLQTLFTGFKAAFNTGFRGAQAQWPSIATLVPSTTEQENYAWLGQFPQLREWIGDRHIKNLEAHDYSIKNKPYEATIAVNRDKIDDDTYGVFSPMFQEMGYAANTHPDSLIWALLAAGFGTLCYDGQFMFDTDHPVGDGTVSNMQAGAVTPWFLLDTRRPLKPLIFQRRKDYQFEALTSPQDEGVFMRKEYRYGVDARVNVGFGFWQQAFGSKAALDKANYKAARAAMMSLKSDEGRPLGIMPNLLVVPPSLEGAALEILNSERDAAGATNVWKGTATPLVVPWLG